MKHLITDLLLHPTSGRTAFQGLFDQIPALEQKKILFAILNCLSATYLSPTDGAADQSTSSAVSAVAGLVAEVVRDDKILHGFLVSWLAAGSNAFTGGIGIRRSVLAVLSKDRENLFTVLQTAVNNFGDQLFIKHAPILQQEGKQPPTTPGPVHLMLTWGPSSCANSSPCSGIRTSAHTHEVGSAAPVFRIPACRLQQNRGNPTTGSVSRDGGGRGSLRSDRQRRN